MRYTILALALLGCAEPTAPAPVTMSGTWATFLRLEGRERPISDPNWIPIRCQGGVVTVLDDQAGTINGGFTKGSLACQFGADPVLALVNWAGPIEGTRRGDSVTLDDGYCRYDGTQQDAHHAAGSVRCDSAVGATVLDLTGTWEATR